MEEGRGRDDVPRRALTAGNHDAQGGRINLCLEPGPSTRAASSRAGSAAGRRPRPGAGLPMPDPGSQGVSVMPPVPLQPAFQSRADGRPRRRPGTDRTLRTTNSEPWRRLSAEYHAAANRPDCLQDNTPPAAAQHNCERNIPVTNNNEGCQWQRGRQANGKLARNLRHIMPPELDRLAETRMKKIMDGQPRTVPAGNFR